MCYYCVAVAGCTCLQYCMSTMQRAGVVVLVVMVVSVNWLGQLGVITKVSISFIVLLLVAPVKHAVQCFKQIPHRKIHRRTRPTDYNPPPPPQIVHKICCMHSKGRIVPLVS